MQPLTTAAQGIVYTVKWAFGLPDVVEILRELKIDQGSQIKIIQKCGDYLIIGIGNQRFALENAVAGRIQV